MKRKNTTRNALFTSIISLLLCVSMLVGTTFAWFTDSVVSGNNVIAAGNLDIDLYNDGNKVTSQTNLFDGVKWEPGVVDYENFTIKNQGNLALLYNFAMNWGSYNTLEGRSLTEILKVAMVDGHVSGDRAAAIAAGEAAGWAALDSWSFKGEMTTQGESKDFALIIYWEPSDNDNNYNVQNGKETSDGQPLYVNLGINLQATQKMHEEDSFGKDYDSLANPWDGSVGEVPKADKEGVITITTAAELAAFAAGVNRGNSYSGKTVKLGANINLNNQSWIAIGDCESGKYFQGTFDGQGYTIYNLNVDYSTDASEHATAGLFGWVDAAMATVKNVNIDGATVKGSHWVGVIAGYFTGRIENCSVNNATVIGNNVNDEANGDKVGGIVGYMNSGAGKLDGNTVTNSTITGNRDVAGLAGAVATTNAVTNNKVENVTVNYSSDYVGEIVSPKTEVVVDDTNTATNVTLVKAVIVSSADELAAALKSTDKDIVITLANNIDVPITSLGQQTGGSGEYKLAGEATETITLDLNGKKLNITTTYWSNIGAKNDDAVFTIKNGTMTSSQATGTWNSYDLTFSNCNYVIEDVVFEKAIAFANTGKTVKLSDVTVNETHDYYAIWICAAGMDVEIDGLTVNSDGRGIKIDEEYEGTPAKVTLKVSNADINTVKKAAIMVKSSAGADITLSNVNIADTIDTVHAVWVDEDSANYVDQVNVTGGKKIYEGNVVSTADELIAMLENGEDVTLNADIKIDPANMSNAYGTTGINVKNGQTIDGNGHTLDIKGAGGTWDSGINTTGGVIKNITITGSFRGIFINHNSDHSEQVVLENVTIDGTTYTISCDQGNNQTLKATGSTFNGWTSYAATLGSAEFIDCSFGKGNGNAYCRPYAPTTFVGCDFKAGYEMDPRAAVTFENCTIGGVALTADNLATLVTSNIANATVK